MMSERLARAALHLGSRSFRKKFEIKSVHIRFEHAANSRVNPSAFCAMVETL
jgi:hypothetical protein